MDLLELLLTFLGGGALTIILSFIHNQKKADNVNQQTINNNLYQQQGKLLEKVERLEKVIDEKDEELLKEKENNFKKDVLIEQLQRKLDEITVKYDELKKDYEEIKLLLIKKEG